MLSVQQDLAAGNHHFSFSCPISGKNHCSDEIKLDAWNVNIKEGPWNRGFFRNYGHYGSPSSHEFSWLADDSTVESPPSRETACSPASQTYATEDYNDHLKHLCSDSRKQDITQHQLEMLNMVEDIPESIYELSLRDLAELPKLVNSIQQCPGKGKEGKFLSGEELKKAKKGMKRASRSESMDHGAFLLKVFFPVSFGGKRKSCVSSSSKMLPKSMLKGGKEGMLEKNTDGQPWKENQQGYLSKNNGTNSRSRKKNGCYSFFQSNKSKTREI